ncbi:SIR2 family protein [Mesorhizobium sp.]|uniref:SIR2 family protein n=1 Tax=Mesorhizobium sp. TaxID=1871066 RepID=UPI003BAAEE9B
MTEGNNPVTGAPPSATKNSFRFLQGKENIIPPAERNLGTAGDAPQTDPEAEWQRQAGFARGKLAQALNGRNIAFLFGSGTSSFSVKKSAEDGWVEHGIPTMKYLAEEFMELAAEDGATTEQRQKLVAAFGLDIADAAYAGNLERLMEKLIALQFGFAKPVSASQQENEPSPNLAASPGAIAPVGNALAATDEVESVILKLRNFLVKKMSTGLFSEGDTKVRDTYERFYRRLVFRERSLPRPWIFTTNYDLFSEQSLDRMGVSYSNGFSGTIDRRFNPAVYRYALAEEIDVGARKWSAVDGYLYLCKLHGSINWVAAKDGLYPVRELPGPPKAGEGDPIIIYPTPAKQGFTLGTPYAELFRQFQERVVREQSVLFVIGYSFSDDHVNNIIYQALSIPTFRLVIFSDPDTDGEIGRLRDLDDPRIWIVGGKRPDGQQAHYFAPMVDDLLPYLPSDRIDVALEKVLAMVGRQPRQGQGETE